MANSGDAIDEISDDFFVYEFKEMNHKVDECPRCPRLHVIPIRKLVMTTSNNLQQP